MGAVVDAREPAAPTEGDKWREWLRPLYPLAVAYLVAVTGWIGMQAKDLIWSAKAPTLKSFVWAPDVARDGSDVVLTWPDLAVRNGTLTQYEVLLVAHAPYDMLRLGPYEQTTTAATETVRVGVGLLEAGQSYSVTLIVRLADSAGETLERELSSRVMIAP